MKLVILRGLPASGKSTYAAQLVQQYHYKRFNRDDLRLTIDNGVYSKSNERFITDVMYTMMEMALSRGYDVVMDNTNLNSWQVQQIINRASQYGPTVEVKDFDTPLQECIERDLSRDAGRVGKEVIMRMYNKFFKDGKFPK